MTTLQTKKRELYFLCDQQRTVYPEWDGVPPKFFGRPIKYLNEYETELAIKAVDGGLIPDADCNFSTKTLIDFENQSKAEEAEPPKEGARPQTKVKAGQGILESAIFDCVESAIERHKGGGVNEEEVNKLIKKYMDDAPAKKIQINDLPEVEIKGAKHHQFEKIFSYLMSGYHIRLVGPTGSGKTHLVQQLHKARNEAYKENKELYALSCTEETSRADLLGRIWPSVNEEGHPSFSFIEGPVTRAAVTGSICLIDEEDAARANVKACLFPLLENGILPVPGRAEGELVEASSGCQIIANANTFGNGANMVYVGREDQDAAWLNRFQMTTFYLDYDKELERSLGIKEVCNWAWELRPEIEEKKLRRQISTRDIIKMSEIIKRNLDNLDDLKIRYFQSWEESERSKIRSLIPKGMI